ncbi:cytosolic carboxypeptidase-like protein 5 [Phlebotomus argentipes]|uniref:cytosolic carboxypeptidase-like protein 5 n=1 Tax=Phlebotomus argentipes TaxID=94469 RepID=UPI002893472D|nr:cytosolic carboxypeptidase-like protein 5 [Phlebotomus argentipes]
MNKFTSGSYSFSSAFDSGNLGKVVLVRAPEENEPPPPDGVTASAEFNLWTCPDCGGTQYENSNRTWFFFSVRGGRPLDVAKFNVMNLNRQAKLYSQGMHPVVKVGANGKWERIKDKPSYTVEDENFIVSFLHRGGEDSEQDFFYAFTYPYTYTELQNYLTRLDRRFRKRQFELKVRQLEGAAGSSKAEDVAVAKRLKDLENACASPDVDPLQLNEEDFKSEIYFHRELLTYSVEKRRVDLITISSYHGICDEREQRLENLFPEKTRHRCHTFRGKRIIFVSSRVHPGETPASFVLNGFLALLLDRKSSIAATLRRLYVFKIVPFLNPDGVFNGLYRSDTLGHNLNRVYLSPSPETHPSIYAVRKLIRFYHFGCDKAECEEPEIAATTEKNAGGNSDTVTSHEPSPEASERESESAPNAENSTENPPAKPEVSAEKKIAPKKPFQLAPISQNKAAAAQRKAVSGRKEVKSRGVSKDASVDVEEKSVDSSNMFLYIDLHGHASKKGVFMYGNHMANSAEAIECMLLPRLMSMNCHHFHFDACNFSERNMYHKGKRDGLSKEGSGRVSVYKMTGLIKSYTLECNYNTGKCVNILPPRGKESASKVVNLVPPKYNPAIFEEIGRALGPSILDLTNSNPISRLHNSDYRSLQGLRNAIRLEIDKSFAKSSHSSSSGSSGGGGGGGKANAGVRKTKVIKRGGLLNPPPPLEISKENKAYCNLQNWESRASVNLVMARGGSRLNLLKGQRKVFGSAAKVAPGASTSQAGAKKLSVVKGVTKEAHPQIPPKRKKVTGGGALKMDKEESLSSATSLPNLFPTPSGGEPLFLPTPAKPEDEEHPRPSCSHEKPPFLQKLKKTHTFTGLPSTSAPTATTSGAAKPGKRLQKSSAASPLKMKRTLKTEPNIKRKKCRVKTVWH